MAYGKIFESMFTGSMVGAGLSVFAVWSYVIASAKPPGTVELNPKIMAAVFGCSVDEVVDAIEKLCSPDPESRTKDFDGRRLIREGEFLYSVPTWEKYNQLRNEIERRAQNREAQRRWREKRKRVSDDVSKRPLTSAGSAHEDADVQAEGTPAASVRPCTSTHSSRCTGNGKQDESPSDEGSQSSRKAELLEWLTLSHYRRSGTHRTRDIVAAVERLDGAGITVGDLERLALLAKTRAKKSWGGLFAHWIDNVDEALKELGKR